MACIAASALGGCHTPSDVWHAADYTRSHPSILLDCPWGLAREVDITKEMRADNNTAPPPSAKAPVMSLKCWGDKPSGLPAEPYEKE